MSDNEDSLFDVGEVVTASEVIVRSTLQELHASLASSRACTYDDSVPALRALGVTGITQLIFACKTCATIVGSAVGVCEPCALRCHGDHDVIELGTKRQQTCDCPTSRSSVPCTARAVFPTATRPPPSAGNTYGHNFEGRFCTCDAAYDRQRDTMLQCLACDEVRSG